MAVPSHFGPVRARPRSLLPEVGGEEAVSYWIESGLFTRMALAN